MSDPLPASPDQDSDQDEVICQEEDIEKRHSQDSWLNSVRDPEYEWRLSEEKADQEETYGDAAVSGARQVVILPLWGSLLWVQGFSVLGNAW